MRQRRILQGLSIAILGFALACGPMTVAGASHHKAKHHKAKKHHVTTTTVKKKTTAAKGGSNPGSSLCASVDAEQTNSSGLGTALEKAFSGGLSNFAGAKQAMIAALNSIEKYEGPAEQALSSAPANVQAALRSLFTVYTTMETDISNANSLTQLETSLETIGTNTQLQADATTVANYVTSVCGTTTTTTGTIP